MYVTKSAVSLLKFTYPVIHHNPPNLPRRRSVLRASLCIPSLLQPAWQELKGKWGRAVRARLSSCTPLNSHTLSTSATPATFIVFPLTQSNLLCCQKRSKTNLASLSLRWIHLMSFFWSFEYSLTSRYGHLSITDSFKCPDKIFIYFL